MSAAMLKFGTVFGHIKTSIEKKNWIFFEMFNPPKGLLLRQNTFM
jgi:hypothetical protein